MVSLKLMSFLAIAIDVLQYVDTLSFPFM